MTDKEYLEKMFALVQELNNFAESEPYDPDFVRDLTISMNLLHSQWLKSRRRRPWAALASIIILLIVLLWILYEILYFLAMRGPQ